MKASRTKAGILVVSAIAVLGTVWFLSKPRNIRHQLNSTPNRAEPDDGPPPGLVAQVPIETIKPFSELTKHGVWPLNQHIPVEGKPMPISLLRGAGVLPPNILEVRLYTENSEGKWVPLSTYGAYYFCPNHGEFCSSGGDFDCGDPQFGNPPAHAYRFLIKDDRVMEPIGLLPPGERVYINPKVGNSFANRKLLYGTPKSELKWPSFKVPEIASQPKLYVINLRIPKPPEPTEPHHTPNGRTCKISCEVSGFDLSDGTGRFSYFDDRAHSGTISENGTFTVEACSLGGSMRIWREGNETALCLLQSVKTTSLILPQMADYSALPQELVTVSLHAQALEVPAEAVSLAMGTKYGWEGVLRLASTVDGVLLVGLSTNC